jgi:DNA-binding transcriptional ArsR family regulator
VLEKEILELLRKKVPCRILLFLFFTPICTQKELSIELDLHPSTVSYHLNKMVKMRIIEEAPVENGIIYPYPDPNDTRTIGKVPQKNEIFYRRKNQQVFQAIGKIMIAHKNSLADKRYIDEYFSYLKNLRSWGLNGRYLEKLRDKKVVEKDGKKIKLSVLKDDDRLYNLFLEIFRPPFCA